MQPDVDHRRSRLCALAVLAVAMVAALAAPPPAHAQGGPPQPIALAGWQYRPDPDNKGEAAGWARGGGGEAGWTNVGVPHVFDPAPNTAAYFGRTGWYRLALTGPPTPAGYGWDLKFGQVRLNAKVWIDGRPIGTSRNPYVPYRIPALGLRPGQQSLVVIRVSNRRPATLREGWWNHGGLTRSTELVPRVPLALENHALLPDTQCTNAGACTASVLLDGRLVNRTPVPLQAKIEVGLVSPSGKATTGELTPAVLPGRSDHREQLRIPIPEPELWSPETPQRYRYSVAVSVNGARTAVYDGMVGLRSVRVVNSRLRLNGRLLALRGAGITEDLPGRGPALRDEDINQIVADLEGLNANVTRAHYLLDPRLLERFDAAGIMVWSEAAVYHADDELRTRRGRARALQTLRGTVRAARRHPSVLTHAVGDEFAQEPDRTPGTADYLRRAAAAVRDLDPSVPPSIALLSYPNIPRQRVYDHFPLLGLNTYYGWYQGKPGIRSTANLGDLVPYLNQMRRKYPAKALAIAEFGAEARFDGPRTQKGTYAFQADYLARVLNIVDRYPFLAGAIYWTAREFMVKPDWTGGAPRDHKKRSPIHAKGLIHFDGRPKPAWDVARERFGRVPALRPPG